jgi:hypothetical protein
MLLGLVLIIINFLLFVKLNEVIQGMGHLTNIEKQIYSAGVGAFNGAIIFVFQEIYNFICLYVIDWENHKYDSELENSYLVKTFVFNFFVSYIGLFYYAFLKHNISADVTETAQSSLNILGTNFASLVVVKNLAAIGKVNILPYVIFTAKNYLFKKKWIPYREQQKKKFVS